MSPIQKKKKSLSETPNANKNHGENLQPSWRCWFVMSFFGVGCDGNLQVSCLWHMEFRLQAFTCRLASSWRGKSHKLETIPGITFWETSPKRLVCLVQVCSQLWQLLFFETNCILDCWMLIPSLQLGHFSPQHLDNKPPLPSSPPRNPLRIHLRIAGQRISVHFWSNKGYQVQ